MKAIKNYTEFEISGLNYEQLLNKLLKYNIPAINIQRTEQNSLILTVENKNVKKLIAVSSGKCYNISRIRTYGIKTFLNGIKAHIGCLIALALCFLLMFINSNFISSVNIQGLNKLKKDQIQQVLSANNIGFFTSKKSVNTNHLENELLSQFNDLSMVSVAIKGTTLQVNLKEKIYVDIIDGSESNNIISPENAKIISMVVTQGTALYKTGDSVKAGDIIVAGYQLDENGNKSTVKAIAKIELDYYLSSKIEVADYKYELERTGESTCYNNYYFNNTMLYNPSTNIPYEFYQVESIKEKMFNLLPFYIQKNTFYKCKSVKVPYNFEADKENLKKQLQYETYDKINQNDTILAENFYITKQNEFNIIVFNITLRKTIN